MIYGGSADEEEGQSQCEDNLSQCPDAVDFLTAVRATIGSSAVRAPTSSSAVLGSMSASAAAARQVHRLRGHIQQTGIQSAGSSSADERRRRFRDRRGRIASVRNTPEKSSRGWRECASCRDLYSDPSTSRTPVVGDWYGRRRRLVVVTADAPTAFDGPVVEVHLSNPDAREPWRHTSVITPVAAGVVAGFGGHSYVLAVHAVVHLLDWYPKRERAEPDEWISVR